MAKFKTGFLLGATCGTMYALLTTKKSGPQRIESLANYSRDVTGATEDVQHAVKRLGSALADLQKEIKETLQPTVKDITAEVTDFQFQTEAHSKALQAQLDNIASTIDEINHDAHSADENAPEAAAPDQTATPKL
ncbi:YtxH domain-containing protein [Lacticaseibacillus jixianensis]|uniref:YtxH domain-containing protein n=1 Tax=Lacticaseibacillus jixianensis TaxID=2486012 RepID=A0ABW4BBA6_9LACO|nr:YtxH domain-containing protein [Lacticaseibacillus jixianensis]